jgi:hypothetical protein
MTQLIKKQRSEKRRENFRALITFSTRVHKTLSEPLDPNSLAGAAEISARDMFVKKIEATTQEKGIATAQALLYEQLLMADIKSVQVEDSGLQKDSVFFNNFSAELRTAGLFNRANAVDLLLVKTKLVRNIKDVFVSKIAQSARKPKTLNATQEERHLLDEYRLELNEWANRIYLLDCAQRKASGKRVRAKTKGPEAADKWLYKMAVEDLKLNEESFLYLTDDELNALPVDGTLHSSPEAPNNTLDFKLSARFFYEQLKK